MDASQEQWKGSKTSQIISSQPQPKGSCCSSLRPHPVTHCSSISKSNLLSTSQQTHTSQPPARCCQHAQEPQVGVLLSCLTLQIPTPLFLPCSCASVCLPACKPTPASLFTPCACLQTHTHTHTGAMSSRAAAGAPLRRGAAPMAPQRSR